MASTEEANQIAVLAGGRFPQWTVQKTIVAQALDAIAAGPVNGRPSTGSDGVSFIANAEINDGKGVLKAPLMVRIRSNPAVRTGWLTFREYQTNPPSGTVIPTAVDINLQGAGVFNVPGPWVATPDNTAQDLMLLDIATAINNQFPGPSPQQLIATAVKLQSSDVDSVNLYDAVQVRGTVLADYTFDAFTQTGGVITPLIIAEASTCDFSVYLLPRNSGSDGQELATSWSFVNGGTYSSTNANWTDRFDVSGYTRMYAEVTAFTNPADTAVSPLLEYAIPVYIGPCALEG